MRYPAVQPQGRVARRPPALAARLAPAVGLLVAAALALFAYRALPARPFAADDYEWLLHVRGRSLGDLLLRAFDPGAQQHFYRPLVWVLLWAEERAFGLDPRPFHALSLALHLLNALLAAWLALRMATGERRPANGAGDISSPVGGHWWAACVPAIFVALHPAPFEAVVWVSAQSELLGAALLLGALHLWRFATGGRRRWLLACVATAALGLAMLTKESAALGLPLLLLLGDRRIEARRLYLLPLALTLAYVALQVAVGQQNSVLREGLYGVGAHMLLNPLRILALVVAPLPGSEHADAGWLVPLGAAVAGALLALAWLSGGGGLTSARRALLALALTLLPTAPFLSPPDSRYHYLPVVMFALVLAGIRLGKGEGRPAADDGRRSGGRRSAAVAGWLVVALLAWYAVGELSAREARFAAASGPGGSLWQLATRICVDVRPERMVLVEPPLAESHARAIVELSCGPQTRPIVVGREGAEEAARPGSVIIAFPGGSAHVEGWR